MSFLCKNGRNISKWGEKVIYRTANNMLMLEQSMQFLWTKQTTINNNIVNAETPGYKTKVVTFEEAFDARLRAAAKGSSSPVTDMRKAIMGSFTTVRDAQETTRMDDNGVNVTEQNVELSRTTYQQQFVMDAINSEISLLRLAIRG